MIEYFICKNLYWNVVEKTMRQGENPVQYWFWYKKRLFNNIESSFLGVKLKAWGKSLITQNMKKETDSEKVVWTKEEKHQEIGVK